MQIFSIVITNFNRTILIEEILEKIHDNLHVKEIIICDDNSNIETILFVDNLCVKYNKVVHHKHTTNVGAYDNKLRGVEYSQCEWVILLDSDNNIDDEYIRICYTIPKQKNTIYAPTFAKPNFNFCSLNNRLITSLDDIKTEIINNEQCIQIALNTGNYLVPRNEYIKIATQGKSKIKYTEVLALSVLWLQAGNHIFFVKDLHYNHLVHHGFYITHMNDHASALVIIKKCIINNENIITCIDT